MSADSLAMMPWFPRDYLAATRHLRLDERGAYQDLLNFQWEMGGLPKERDRLAMLLGVSLEDFERVWAAIGNKFVEINGLLVNKRLEEHRQFALQQREKKRNGAAIANAKRSAQRSAEHGAERSAERTHRAASAERLASATPPSPSPSPSMKEEETHTHAHARAQVDVHERFEQWRAAYPPFAGRQNWAVVEARYHTLLERGVTADDLDRAVERYAAYVAAGGVSSTAHVLRPDTFLAASDEPWRQPWTPPVAIPRTKAAQPKFVAPPDDPAEVASA